MNNTLNATFYLTSSNLFLRIFMDSKLERNFSLKTIQFLYFSLTELTFSPFESQSFSLHNLNVTQTDPLTHKLRNLLNKHKWFFTGRLVRGNGFNSQRIFSSYAHTTHQLRFLHNSRSFFQNTGLLIRGIVWYRQSYAPRLCS